MPVHLIIQYCNDPRPPRQAEYDECVRRNLDNPHVAVVHNLVEPGTLYGDRVNEIDVRFAKILRVRGVRTNIGIDVYNLINSASVLTYNQNYNPTGNWLVPTSVIQPRFVKFSTTIDF